ncbi:SPOR domain-containing protein [Metabacillus sp. 84]|uniref:SPOR domain-containing protein n=1 Tax=unclassified Metabacillus TaxID=2675274 RepID=UPI003CEFC0CB
MDKQQKKGRTIKINMNGESVKPTVIPFSSWEENAAKESAAASEKKDEFNWVLPDDDAEVYEEDPKVLIQKKEKKKGFSFAGESSSGLQDRLFPVKQFLFTVIVAVVLGVSFGFIALNVISNDEMPAAVQTEGSAGEGETAPAALDAKPADGAKAVTGNLTSYVVQNGKFSSKASADQVAGEIKGKGYAAAIREEDGSFFVYGGIGLSKEETAGLSKVYQESKLDAWGGKQAQWEVAGSEKAAADMQKAVGDASGLAIAAINGSQLDAGKLKEALKAAEEIKSASPSLSSSLLEAVSQLSKESSPASGWKAQQMILDGLNVGK